MTEKAKETIQKVTGVNWRTNAAGTLTLVMVLLGAIKLALDGKLMEVNFLQVMEALGGLAVAFGFFSARDNKVTSEAAGLKP
jgi:hypothetical protein